MAISWLLYTNLQNKTLCWLLCTNLQNKTHYRRVTPFARSQKSQHKYIVSNWGWKHSPIINKRWVGERGWKKNVLGEKNRQIKALKSRTKFCFKMTLLNFWIKLTQKGYFRTKKNENYHRILHIQINLDSKFQLQQTILIFGTNFQKKYTSGQKHKKWTSLLNSSYSN